MIDLRPIVYVVGRIMIVLAILMLVPAFIDYRAGSHNGTDFLQCAFITGCLGGLLSLATANGLGRALNARQAYLMTVAIWSFVPLFGALPFMLGEPHLSFTDAYFEAVSGITTTGATVIVGLDGLPDGMNLWRGMLNWLGGLGIAFIAMIFLPVLRVGGMQYFRTEGFDTFGKALPRATDIARQLLIVYSLLTAICIAVYGAVGMTALDAVVIGLATVATGGFAPSDLSFTKYPGLAEYAGGCLMIMSALPYIRFVQLIAGAPVPLWRDSQVRAFLKIFALFVPAVALWRILTSDMAFEPALRETFFNIASVATGTGFFSGSFAGWGGFSMLAAFVIGVIGGCSGSSSGALTVFRVQVTVRALMAQIRRIVMPSRVVTVKYDGRVVTPDVMSGIILFVSGYIFLIGVLTVAMTLVDVDAISALFGVWTAIGNIGYGYGPLTVRTGTFVDFPTAAKWILTGTMILGRLGLLAILVVVLPRFWRL